MLEQKSNYSINIDLVVAKEVVFVTITPPIYFSLIQIII